MVNEQMRVREWRQSTRRALLAARIAMDPELHRQRSALVLERLRELASDWDGKLVGAYSAFRGEVDLGPLLWGQGAKFEVALPCVTGKGEPLEFRVWKPGDAMARGVLDLPFPAEGGPVAPQILLVPVVGFDALGYRLGYGGGFYDRTLLGRLSEQRAPLTIGVGFASAGLETIYPQPHDVPLDLIVTESAVIDHRLGLTG